VAGGAKEEGGTGGAQAIRRAMDVVRAVAQMQRTGASLSRVVKATDLNRSTAFRILRSLTEERMLRFNEATRTYHLGLLAFELGLATQAESHVQTDWNDVIEGVALKTRLTTYLMARSDMEAVCLICKQGSTTIRAMPLDVGQRLPLGIGAGSLALLATLDDAEIEQILAANASRLQLFPGTDQAQLIHERIVKARQNGYTQSAGSVGPGLVGVGVPVLPRKGLLQLAISVSAVADTMDAREARQIAGIIDAAIRKKFTETAPALPAR
jgi:DNA-binding IclR family transcriptional regulator